MGRAQEALRALQPHMRRALLDIKKNLTRVDVVVEMRDARLPFASKNLALGALIDRKPKRVLLMNKADLAGSSCRQVTRTALQTPACKVLFTSKDDKNSVTKVLEAVREWLPNKQGQGEVYVMMVVGVPNVGKSTFINALKQHAHKQGLLRADRVSQLTVGPLPGVTKQVLGFKVTDDPALVLVDTPGIMMPKITESLFGYRMALAGLVPADRIDTFALVRFTLYMLSQPGNHDQLKLALARRAPTTASNTNTFEDADHTAPGRGRGNIGIASLWGVPQDGAGPQPRANSGMDHSQLRRLMQCKRIAKVTMQALARRDAQMRRDEALDLASDEAAPSRRALGGKSEALASEDVERQATASASGDGDGPRDQRGTGIETGAARAEGRSARQQAADWTWGPFVPEEWDDCAQDVIMALSKQSDLDAEDADEVLAAQATNLLLRVVREGHLGSFMFEDMTFAHAQPGVRRVAASASEGADAPSLLAASAG